LLPKTPKPHVYLLIICHFHSENKSSKFQQIISKVCKQKVNRGAKMDVFFSLPENVKENDANTNKVKTSR